MVMQNSVCMVQVKSARSANVRRTLADRRVQNVVLDSTNISGNLAFKAGMDVKVSESSVFASIQER